MSKTIFFKNLIESWRAVNQRQNVDIATARKILSYNQFALHCKSGLFNEIIMKIVLTKDVSSKFFIWRKKKSFSFVIRDILVIFHYTQVIKQSILQRIL